MSPIVVSHSSSPRTKEGEKGKSTGADATEMTVEIESCEVTEKFDSVGETSAGRSSVVVLFERKEVAVGDGVMGTEDPDENPRIIDDSERSEGI